MDYSKSGGAKSGKREPRHSEHNAPGSAQKPFGDAPAKAAAGRGTDKASLLARMKAAAAAKKAD